MSNTIKFQCHIQISSKKLLDEVKGKTLSFMTNSKTIDENGEVIFDCELQERDKHKSFPITIEDEEYIIVGTGQCNAIAHQKSTNPFCLTLNKDDEANIRHIRIYKEQDKVDSKKQEQIDIYTAQVEKREDTATQQTSTDDIHTSQTPLQENQNLIHLEAHLTSGKALKKDIHWAYYVKYRNEPLWEKSKIKKENLESLTFTQKAKHNTQVSFDINAKFKYTIKEDEIQKEVEDYLKEKQQLIIFAYKNNPAYQTSNGQTHTILNISTLPIVEVTSKTLKILYASTNITYDLTQSCDTYYLNENLSKDKVYILQLTESSLHIKDKESNKDIALILTKEFPIQEKQILLDSQNFQALQNVLNLHRQKDNVEVYVEVELSRWDRIKEFYLNIDKVSEQEKKESKQRIGKEKLQQWVNSNLNIFGYGEELFVKTEVRYYKIKGAIYTEFMKSPYNYINTCAARMSKALNDFGIAIKKLQGMRNDTYIANAGMGANSCKILVKVKDMIDFLELESSFGEPIIFETQINQSNKEFRDEVLSKLDNNGIVAIKVKDWGDAWGHIALWDSREQKFLDDENYLTRGDYVEQVYFWKIED